MALSHFVTTCREREKERDREKAPRNTELTVRVMRERVRNSLLFHAHLTWQGSYLQSSRRPSTADAQLLADALKSMTVL